MSHIVFGAPITEETLKVVARIQGKDVTTFTALDRSRTTLTTKGDEKKEKKADTYLEKLRFSDKVNGVECLVFNAIGGRLVLDSYQNWGGTLGSGPYPVSIENGQFGAFFHGMFNGAKECSGAVCYTGVYDYTNGSLGEWVLAWKHTPGAKTPIQCRAEVSEKALYRKGTKGAEEAWKKLKKELETSSNYKQHSDGIVNVVGHIGYVDKEGKEIDDPTSDTIPRISASMYLYNNNPVPS